MTNLDNFKKLLGCVDWLTQQHLYRYLFASQFSSRGLVLDLACGIGYGAEYLSEKAKTVIGIDLEKGILGFAARAYRKDNLIFIQSDCENLPFQDRVFDCVVSLETIEHLFRPGEFLREIRRVIKPQGTFICSTPNKRFSLSHIEHLHEYYPLELFGVLRNHFREVELKRQYCRREEWAALKRQRDKPAKRFSVFLGKTRRKLRNWLPLLPGGRIIKNILKQLLFIRKEPPPPLKIKKESFSSSLIQSLDPYYRVREIDPESNGLDNALVAVARGPRPRDEQVKFSVRAKFAKRFATLPLRFVNPGELRTPSYQSLVNEIIDISRRTKWACSKGPLHPSREWEYPWGVFRLNLKPGMKILDAGSSINPFSPLLASRGTNVTAIDDFSSHDIPWDFESGIFSGELTGWAKLMKFQEVCRQELGIEIAYFEQDMAATDFCNNFFDRIICISVLEHLPIYKQKLILLEWNRILKPGGEIVLTVDFIRPENTFNLVSFLKNSPFHLKGPIDVLALDNYEYVVAGMVLERKALGEKKINPWARFYRKHPKMARILDATYRRFNHYSGRIKSFIKK